MITFNDGLIINNTETMLFGGNLYIDNKFMDVFINGPAIVDSQSVDWKW